MFIIRIVIYAIGIVAISAFVLYKFPGTREYVIENLLPADDAGITLKSVSDKLKKIDQNIAKIKTAATLKEIQPLIDETQSVIQESEKIIEQHTTSSSPFSRAISGINGFVNTLAGADKNCPAP